MKTTLYILCFLSISFWSCDSDNDPSNEPTGANEEILISLDGAANLDFSQNIIAQYVPVAATTGQTGGFGIKSEDASGNEFLLLFPSQYIPDDTTTPFSFTFQNNISMRFKVAGVTFDDAQPNNITFNVTAYGAVGSMVEVNFNGTYYQTGDTNPHTISGTIKVERDPNP